jgi:hypothetical protein
MPDDPIIHLDYGALREDDPEQAAITPDMIKKAQGVFGKRHKETVMKAMDALLRLQAAEIAQRRINPQSLYEAGREAVLLAIDEYRIGQTDSFRKFAKSKAKQAMVSARDKLSKQSNEAWPG